jgi:hypothetical protein
MINCASIAHQLVTFTFSLDGKGNLHMRPVEPMNAGDQFVWATHVWTRIG